MPAGAIGASWVSGSWSDSCWELGTWADGSAAVLLPTNVIIASQSVTEVDRRIGYTDVERSIGVTHARRTVTFDG